VPNADLSAEEMNYLLFGADKESESPVVPNPMKLTPAPHSQNWEYQVTMAKMGKTLVSGSDQNGMSGPESISESERKTTPDPMT